MATVKDALVPDIGDFKEVEVIDVLVKPGDTVQPEDPLVTLESDKASMDIPATDAGIVQEITVKVGDKISEGSVILRLLTSDDLETAEAAAPTPETAPPAEPGPPPSPESAPRASEPSELWWTSHDGSGEMPMGEYASEADALAAISAARHELLAECGTEQQRRDILAGRWTVVRTTPEE